MDGVMARQVADAAVALGIEARQVREGAEALVGADAVFLTNSLIGVRPAFLAAQAAPAPHAHVQRLTDAVSRFV